MIKVVISGCSKRKLRECIRAAAFYYIKDLLPKKRNLDIRIIIDPTLLKIEKMAGACQSYVAPSNKNPTRFTIYIDKTLDVFDTLSILAHEMAHVKQYTRGQLKYDRNDDSVSIWEGTPYVDADIEYDKHPWEIDAVANELRLQEKFIKCNKQTVLTTIN